MQCNPELMKKYGISEDELTLASASEKENIDQMRPSVTYWKDAFARFRRNKLAIVMFFLLLLIVLMAIFGPILSPYTYKGQSRDVREGPSWRHLLGTDNLGRDQFTRLMYGTDTYNISRDGKTPEEAWGYRPTHLRMFLEGQEDFEYAGDIIQPLKLDGRQKRLILRDNLIAHLGECHRPADYALAAEECARLREMLKKGEFGDRVSGERIPMESRNLEVMEAFFRGQPAVR